MTVKQRKSKFSSISADNIDTVACNNDSQNSIDDDVWIDKQKRISANFLQRKRTFFILGLTIGGLIISILLQQTIELERLNIQQFIMEHLPSLNGINSDLLTNITSFLTENLSTVPLPAHSLTSALHAHFPVILVPGIVSTNLESWARGGCSDAYFRKKVWGDISMASSLLLDKECWLEIMKLDPKTGLDSAGSRIRASTGIDAASYFMPGYWVWAKLIENLGFIYNISFLISHCLTAAIIGYDVNDMYMAAYDWRLSLHHMEKRDGYFTKLKSQIELSKKLSGRKVVLISHSMGGNVVHYFLKWVESIRIGNTPGWVENHIHALIDIAPPLLGVPKTITAVISGEARDTAQLGWVTSNLLERFFTRAERASLFQSWGGLSSMLPKGGEAIWGNLDNAPDQFSELSVIQSFGKLISFKEGSGVALANQNYTASTIYDLLKSYLPDTFGQTLNEFFSHGIIMEDLASSKYDHPKYWSNPLEHALPNAPSMKIFSFYGVGKLTERSYVYDYSESVLPLTYEVLNDFELDHKNVSKGDKKKKVLNTATRTETDRVVGLHLNTEISNSQEGLNSGVQDTDGDGTVPLLSLGFMSVAGWRHGGKHTYGHIYNPAKIPIITREYLHTPLPMVKDSRGGPSTADHVDILGNHQMTIDILKIVSGKDENISDQFHSKIRDIVKRIKLKEEKPKMQGR